MLRSNGKKAIENIHKYILDNFSPENYKENFWAEIEKNRKNPLIDIDKFSFAASFIMSTFFEEKISHDKRKLTKWEYFLEWSQGLPSVLSMDYWYYNRNAVDVLAEILEETGEEKENFIKKAKNWNDAESNAAEKLTWLLFRELKKFG